MNSLYSVYNTIRAPFRDLSRQQKVVALAAAGGAVAYAAIRFFQPEPAPQIEKKTPYASADYESLLSCMPKGFRKALERELGRPDFEKNWSELSKIIENGDYLSDFFKSDVCRFTILEGVRKGRISDIQGATLLHNHELVRTEPSARYIPIRGDEEIDLLYNSCNRFHPKVSKEALRQEIQKLPQSERGFFLIENSPSKSEEGELIRALTNASDAIPFFCQDVNRHIKKSKWNSEAIASANPRMFASIGLYQAYLNGAFPGKEGVRLRPRIGMSILESIRENGLKSERDLFVPFSGFVAYPENVDSFSYHGASDIAVHDVFHALRMGYIPSQCRAPFILASDELRMKAEILCSDTKGQTTIKKVVAAIRDMDFGPFERAYVKRTVYGKEVFFEKVILDSIQRKIEKASKEPGARELSAEKEGRVVSLLTAEIQKQVNSTRP